MEYYVTRNFSAHVHHYSDETKCVAQKCGNKECAQRCYGKTTNHLQYVAKMGVLY